MPSELEEDFEEDLELDLEDDLEVDFEDEPLSDELVTFMYFLATYPVLLPFEILYQLPEVSFMVTVSPSRSVPTTLLSEEADFRIFREEAVTLPLFARAEHNGSMHKSRISIAAAFHLFIRLSSFPDYNSAYLITFLLSCQSIYYEIINYY